MLRLVRNGKILYTPTLDDYNLCCEMKVPLTKISQDMMPLLSSRCKKNKVGIKVYPFEEVEQHKHKKIKKKWKHGFEIDGDTINIDIPKKKSVFKQAQSLVEAISNFYGRNMFDVAVSNRKYPSKIRFVIEKSLNTQRNPEWK